MVHGFDPSRRNFCLCCLGATAFAASGGWLSPREVFAKSKTIVDMIRQSAAETPITVHPLRGALFVLEGSGGNIGVFAGRDGKLLVDAGITASKPRIEKALLAMDETPVTRLVNTHWHFDHADGNEWLAKAGATISGTRKTQDHLKSAQRVEDWNFDFPPSPASAIPAEIVDDGSTLAFGGKSLHFIAHPGAHTDGDISVKFEDDDVVHAGDVYWNGIYPFIDYSTGGGIDGMIRGSEAILASAGDRTIIIPGHGQPVSNRRELQAYRDMLVSIRDAVAGLKAKGQSFDEIVAAKPTAPFDAKWGQYVIGPDFITRLVYEGV